MAEPLLLDGIPNSPPAVEANPEDLIPDTKVGTGLNIFACPVCYHSFIDQSDSSLSITSPAGSCFECHACKKAYLNNGIYLDLTIAGGLREYDQTLPFLTKFFRKSCLHLPSAKDGSSGKNIQSWGALISYLYERGWRQSFRWGGFPGPERELEMAKYYLRPAKGGTIVDASCGSGLFSRLFAKSGIYSLVVALDFSENMLQHCNKFIKQEGISKKNLILVRADICRLPFVSSSIDAVHAGAALHCWSSPSAAVAEISRILRPGGVFVATTFIFDVIPIAVPVLRMLRKFYIGNSSNYIFLSEGELKDLCEACGLVGVTCIRHRLFVMISAIKPN